MSFDIVLKHISGERKTVPVEYVSPNLTYLTVRWDMAGQYDLNLSVNVLTPRSMPGQPKGKAKWYKKDKPLWKAEDLAAVRKMASDYINAKRGNTADETRAAMKRHAESMPGRAAIAGVLAQELANPRIGAYEPFPRYTGDPDTDD